MFELELAISEWRRQLAADLSKSQNVLDELEDGACERRTRKYVRIGTQGNR